MDKIFETLLFNRNSMLKMLNHLSYEQLSLIPKGYRNSIFWNIAHVVVTQQLICYKLSNLPMIVSEELIDRYKKGTIASENISQNDIVLIKDLLVKSIDKTKIDFDANSFQKYTSYPTSTGVTLNNIEEALIFNTFHEGIHLGVCLSLKKIV